MVQARLLITGFVQGVGFRRFIQKQAQEMIVGGWVRNMPEGGVEVLLQGERQEVEMLIDACHKGPFLAEVEEVEIIWEGITQEYADFSVRNMPS
jgi:acylphosphatase